MSERNEETKDESRDDSQSDSGGVGISDDQLPDDLVPGDDNPLAEGLPDGETVEGLLTDGGRGESAEDEQDDESDA